MKDERLITSLQNDTVKLTKLLQTDSRRRRKEGLIVLEGVRLVGDALAAGARPVHALFSPELTDGTLRERVRGAGGTVLAVSEAVLHHAADTQQPQGVVAVFAMPASRLPAQPRAVLILDALRDPGNLGTILRTAAAAGVEAVLLAPTCVDPYNPKSLRAGMGAHFRVPLAQRDWDEIALYCSQHSVYLADGAGDLTYDRADWSGRWALVIGGEAHGAGGEASRLAQHRIRIPMAADTESLNAAVAAAVILFEARKYG